MSSLADLELCLVHSIHEHVKRDHIFCIITANGNAYHLQVCIIVSHTHTYIHSKLSFDRLLRSLKLTTGLQPYTVVGWDFHLSFLSTYFW